MNLGFVILYVHNMDMVRAFYTGPLGMTVVEAVSGPNFVALRSGGGALLALQDNATAQFPPRHETQPGNVEISFEVDDVDDTWQRWKESGVEMVTSPIDLPFGRYFMARDPEGHYLSAYRFARQAATPPTSASPGS